jgi:hypothetical protein
MNARFYSRDMTALFAMYELSPNNISSAIESMNVGVGVGTDKRYRGD